MRHKKYFSIALTGMLLTIALALAGLCDAQEKQIDGVVVGKEPLETAALPAEGPDAENREGNGMSLFELIKKGWIVGYMIILLSFVALGLVIDYAVTIRRSKLAPARDIAVFRKLIQDKKFDEIQKLDQGATSFLSHIVIAGLKESQRGYQSMIKAMEDTAEALSARIARKIEHLNVIGNISPMLGLLGTVIGMLRCFNEISRITTAIEPRQLAGGIFEALVTTCMGLVVAIPSLYFYAIFRNRVDEFTGEASIAAEELISSFKPGNQKD